MPHALHGLKNDYKHDGHWSKCYELTPFMSVALCAMPIGHRKPNALLDLTADSLTMNHDNDSFLSKIKNVADEWCRDF